MTDIFWEFRQENRISDAKADASIASAQAKNARHVVYALENRIDKLTLICQSMWSLIQDKTDLTETDLLKRVTDIDLQDGKLDGKYARPIVKCKKCDSAISHQFRKCLFCGEEYTEGDVFSTV
jgi:hypothetical protein